MKLKMRPYQGEDDYWRMRAFLREVFTLNGRRERSWQAYRLDYHRRHGIENLKQGTMETDFFIWEDAGGRIVSVLNSEGRGNAFLQVHPEAGGRTVQVSRTTILLNNGSPGFNRPQIHRARFSLVGFSNPSISFK